ncbi:TniB family NTP-binding protein [Shewanella vesiculosa]|uniref:TniB family NTP-binding protein n=1 Tax=Shewanella vesiculosa TaxID=518738 RepID=UPI00384F35A3
MANLLPQRKAITEKFLSTSIYHRECEEVIHALEQSLKTTGRNPSGLMIVGESGVGKSTAIRLFQKKYCVPATDTHSYQTIVSVITPESATIKSLTSALLAELGCHTPDKGTAHAMKSRAVTLINNLQTKMIIFDEIQHLTERNAQRRTQDVINFVKTLMLQTHCPVVLVGMPDARELLNTDQQLQRRFSKSVELKPFSLDYTDNDEEMSQFDEYCSFLNAIIQIMPIKTINIEDEQVAFRLFAASKGKISVIIKLFEQLIENNIDGTTAGLADFSKAFSEISDYPIKQCPFQIPYKNLKF